MLTLHDGIELLDDAMADDFDTGDFGSSSAHVKRTGTVSGSAKAAGDSSNGAARRRNTVGIVSSSSGVPRAVGARVSSHLSSTRNKVRAVAQGSKLKL